MKCKRHGSCRRAHSGGFYPNLAKPDEAKNQLKGGFYRSQPTAGDAGNRLTGGFYPTAMGSILTTGPFFATAALLQGRRLISNNTARMKSRARAKSRGSSTRKNKRS